MNVNVTDDGYSAESYFLPPSQLVFSQLGKLAERAIFRSQLAERNRTHQTSPPVCYERVTVQSRRTEYERSLRGGLTAINAGEATPRYHVTRSRDLRCASADRISRSRDIDHGRLIITEGNLHQCAGGAAAAAASARSCC